MAWRKEHCCEMMHHHAERECDQHPNRFDCPDALISYNERTDSYGIIIHKPGISVVAFIQYCPWCGSGLRDLSDQYFALLDELGFEDYWDDARPAEFHDGEWWRSRGL